MAKFDIFLRRALNVQLAGDVTLLDAVVQPDGGVHNLQLFYASGTPQGHFRAGKGLEINQLRSIGNAPVLSCTTERSGPVTINVAETAMEIHPSAPETELFAALNVGFAIRNGESVETTLEWLDYHITHHGMEAALILDRAKPNSDKRYVNKLKNKAAKINGLKRLVLLRSNVPLGKPDLPAESHPVNAPGAPGKDRMEIPPPDPWSSPLGELQLFELVRVRFLAKARAVMNIEIHDLVVIGEDRNIFDRAGISKTGCLQMDGHQIYPWRVRNTESVKFGDHICRQFDIKDVRKRWCVAPAVAKKDAVWRLTRVVGAAPTADETVNFLRCMALRHPTKSVSKIAPKASLIEDQDLLILAKKVFNYNPARPPNENTEQRCRKTNHTTIVTTMKNEGPFILEWLAYHRAIGIKDFLIYTNDCTDGTDTMLQMLQEKGYLQHRENQFRKFGLKPQHAAFLAADDEPIVKGADWLISMDVDEFINIKCGDGRLGDLFDAIGDANMIAITWRLFGNGDIHEFSDRLVTEQFDRCAHELIRKPHQAWGFKTLFHNIGIFKKMGVHRPKGLKPQLWQDIKWVNGSGNLMPSNIFRNGWRSTVTTYGYDLVQMNHYAVRSAESFLVKRDRGRVNHVARDQGLAYWFRMNNNATQDHSIQRMIPAMRIELDKMMADPDIATAHAHSVKMHRIKINELKATKNYAAFFKDLTGSRMEKLSRMHAHFGANVFLLGPEVVPDEVVEKDPDEKFFFTVEKGTTVH